VTKSLELLWLDSIDARDRGDIAEALDLAKKVVEQDEDHCEAWMAIAQLTLPQKSRGRQVMPDLVQSAKALSALKKVVELDPHHPTAWELGGTLIVDHLGMLELGLEWWQQRHLVSPNEIVPVIEQMSIFVRLGDFKSCDERLEMLTDGSMEIPPNKEVEARIFRVRNLVEKARKFEEKRSFRPQNEKDEGWEAIRRMRKRKPISETFFLLTFVFPIVFMLGTTAMIFLGSSGMGTAMVFALIILSYFVISHLSMGLLQSLNRHAFDLDRALDVEATVGKACIPDTIRGSKLYDAVISKRLPAFRERLALIASSEERVPAKWSLAVPF
tara:strand:+ start:320 stop:1303 length:984 start_codon:yes stop_codon:yes gene_type:complete